MAIQDSMLCQKKSQMESGIVSPVGDLIGVRTSLITAMIIMNKERQRTVPRASLRLRSILTFHKRQIGMDMTGGRCRLVHQHNQDRDKDELPRRSVKISSPVVTRRYTASRLMMSVIMS